MKDGFSPLDDNHSKPVPQHVEGWEQFSKQWKQEDMPEKSEWDVIFAVQMMKHRRRRRLSSYTWCLKGNVSGCFVGGRTVGYDVKASLSWTAGGGQCPSAEI